MSLRKSYTSATAHRKTGGDPGEGDKFSLVLAGEKERAEDVRPFALTPLCPDDGKVERIHLGVDLDPVLSPLAR